MILRGPILNPRADGSVDFIPDGFLVDDGHGRIEMLGHWSQFTSRPDPSRVLHAMGLICPPFFDDHIHIPQHPIRGHFMDDVGANPPEGRLVAGLNQNVFPAESKCADDAYTRQVVRDFLKDTLAHGVIGGAAYMTVHASAARIALEMLPDTWSLGPVLMNMNCPAYLRTDTGTWERDLERLAADFGRRVIVTDRFAVSVSTPLRRSAAALAKRLGLRMQTHLNEQLPEKRLVEQKLYPDAGTYTDVYDRDGLLDCEPILAHCVRMSMGEFHCVSWHGGASIAHCPTSNTLLGSGIMPLDHLYETGIEYAICTDVGASPTTSLLAEMSQFLKVHAGASRFATPAQALYRVTLAPAKMLGLEHGTFEPGRPMSFVEIEAPPGAQNADQAIVSGMLAETCIRREEPYLAALQRLQSEGLDLGPELELLEQDVRQTVQRLDRKVMRVVIDGKLAWQRA